HDQAIVDMHEGMIKTLHELRTSARTRIDATSPQAGGANLASMRLIATISILTVLLVLLIPFRDYLFFARPLKRLREYAQKLSAEKGIPQPRPGLKGEYGQVEGVLHDLVLTVESQRKGRHKYIQGIVDDLASPLAMLKKGRSLANSDADEATQLKAADSVRRGLALLSG